MACWAERPGQNRVIIWWIPAQLISLGFLSCHQHSALSFLETCRPFWSGTCLPSWSATSPLSWSEIFPSWSATYRALLETSLSTSLAAHPSWQWPSANWQFTHISIPISRSSELHEPPVLPATAKRGIQLLIEKCRGHAAELWRSNMAAGVNSTKDDLLRKWNRQFLHCPDVTCVYFISIWHYICSFIFQESGILRNFTKNPLWQWLPYFVYIWMHQRGFSSWAFDYLRIYSFITMEEVCYLSNHCKYRAIKTFIFTEHLLWSSTEVFFELRCWLGFGS